MLNSTTNYRKIIGIGYLFLFFRYLNPPAYWVTCTLESRELMALCLKRLKNLSKMKLIDANFVWTEPHSKRIKVWKLFLLLNQTIQMPRVGQKWWKIFIKSWFLQYPQYIHSQILEINIFANFSPLWVW